MTIYTWNPGLGPTLGSDQNLLNLRAKYPGSKINTPQLGNMPQDHIRDPCIISGMFLNSGVWSSLGRTDRLLTDVQNPAPSMLRLLFWCGEARVPRGAGHALLLVLVGTDYNVTPGTITAPQYS